MNEDFVKQKMKIQWKYEKNGLEILRAYIRHSSLIFIPNLNTTGGKK